MCEHCDAVVYTSPGSDHVEGVCVCVYVYVCMRACVCVYLCVLTILSTIYFTLSAVSNQHVCLSFIRVFHNFRFRVSVWSACGDVSTDVQR